MSRPARPQQARRPQRDERRNPTPKPLPGRPFYLHTGVHKTGTTALQKFLHDNAAALDRLGIHRLQTGLLADNAHSWGNHDLAWTLRDQDSKALWPAAAAEADPYQAVLASSEEFSSIKQVRRYKIVHKAMKGFTTRPIFYLRRQDQLLESTYNYHVKTLGETGSIMEFAERILKRLEFDQMLEWPAGVFGEDAIIVRIYDSSHLNGDIFDDFLAALGLTDTDGLVKPGSPMNPGLTRDGLDKMLEANRRYRDAPEKLQSQRKRILESCAAPSWTEHEILTEAERRAVLQKFRPGNRLVARRFLDRTHLF